MSETTKHRIEQAKAELRLSQIAAILAFGSAIMFVLAFLQEPLAHDAMHSFRHAAGIICH